MAVTIRQTRPLTGDELLDLSERNPGYQLERARDGRLIVTPTGGRAGMRSAEVLAQLHHWNRRHELGVVFDSSTGFSLPDGSILAPDAAWIGAERWNALSAPAQEAYPPLCPDAVFEVRSKSDALDYVRAKMHAYIENGARLGVLIDPYDRFVEVYRPNRAPEHSAAPQVALDSELPGFTLDATRL